MAQNATGTKTNEITSISELLSYLELKGCIVSIDAIGCQSEFAEKIRKKDGDYVLALKGNKKILHDKVDRIFHDFLERNHTSIPYDQYHTEEKGHGRNEKRSYYSFSKNIFNELDDEIVWMDFKSVTAVHSTREIKGQFQSEIHFF
ncbi:MAG: ISAs1 family transposase [Oligoflexia bacterium]|nr:ISAs1 family transposase [Oligoflexia bacterium]